MKEKIVIIHPIEIDSSLVNPGRGFTTTGYTYNENQGNRLHPLSGVIQKRWYWDVETAQDITQWMPGLSDIQSSVIIPGYIAAGDYQLFVGLINPCTKRPAIKLAIEGKTEDGWYILGKIKIMK